MVRHCLRCGREITACNGFQLARDTLAAMNGEVAWSQVREHCGFCAEWINLLSTDARRAYFTAIPDLTVTVHHPGTM